MDIVPQKRCIICKQDFPATLEFFYKHNQCKDGLHPRCKNCFGIGKKPREGYVDGKKRCRRCNNYFPPTDEFFSARSDSTDKLSYHCRDCMKKFAEESNRKRGAQPRKPPNPIPRHIRDREKNIQRVTEWQKEHPEQTKENKRKYQQSPRGLKNHLAAENSRRARKAQASGTFTAGDIERMLRRQKGKCYYCKKKLGTDRRAYHVDHAIPLSRGGTNDPSNLVITCPPCNEKKGKRMPHEWPEGGRLL